MKDTERQQARAGLAALVAGIKTLPEIEGRDTLIEALVQEIEALDRAIGAFHMEAIRFRMYTVDRRLQRLSGGTPETLRRTFNEVRAALEAAGFHTRSH